MNTTVLAPSPAAVVPPRYTLPERARSHLLPIAIALSLAVHCVVLVVKFIPPDARLLENVTPPLEVVLVNSKSIRKPNRADAMAQANLDGGGNTEANRRAKSNLPVVPDETDTDEVTLATQRVANLEAEMKRLLTQSKSLTPVDSRQDSPAPLEERSDAATKAESVQARTKIARLEAQIAREWDQYQKLPKRKFIGARTEGVVYAQYVDDWRQKIERIGTHNFPEEARRRGLYATLLITVSIRSDGSVEKVDIDRSSGSPVLDRAARRIVELSSPFAPFPPAIRRQYDILSITRNWAFTRSDELVTE